MHTKPIVMRCLELNTALLQDVLHNTRELPPKLDQGVLPPYINIHFQLEIRHC